MSIEKLTIRRAVCGDGETIGSFQIACAKEVENRQLSPREVEAGVMRILSLMGTPGTVGDYIVLENGNKEIIACCLLQLQFSDWNCGCYLHVESVYVHPDFRGSEVFSQMYAYIDAYAVGLGQICEIRSTISLHNQRMHAALTKVNWKETIYKVFAKDILDCYTNNS